MKTRFKSSRITSFLAGLALCCGVAFPALAWDAIPSGRVTYVEVTAGGNLGVRVFLEGYPTLCSSGQNWAYLNETDSNYKAYLAYLLFAQAAGKNVRLWLDVDGGACHIGYLGVW